MRYLIMAVAALLAATNWMQTADGQKFKRQFLEANASNTDYYSETE